MLFFYQNFLIKKFIIKVFCCVFAVGGCLSEVDGIDYRKQFSTWWKTEMKVIKYPNKGTVFDFFIQENRLQEWV